MGIDFKITIDSEEFRIYNGAKINYSDTIFESDAFNIQNNSLLFDEIIVPQQIICFETDGTKVFFETGGDLPFDIFAASFYLLTRYEEYLPHEKDVYGRYAHENSLAYKEGFINLPLINIWVNQFSEKLKKRYPMLNIQYPVFKFQPTYDIDIAYAYKQKGFIRNTGGFIKFPSAERIRVLSGLQEDPFDSYDWLHELHQKNKLEPVYFFLVAERNGEYDKNILPHKDAMWKLIKQHAKKYSIGLHPSWQSGDIQDLLRKEKNLLESMGDCDIKCSRQHYIRFNLPEGYNRLPEAGITDDYSMGYGSINGFRASVASSFYWYDLENEEQTGLRIHPFCFMDANSFYEQKQNPQQTFEELLHYLSACRKFNGTFITIWHNNFLGANSAFKGWKEVYEKFILQALQ